MHKQTIKLSNITIYNKYDFGYLNYSAFYSQIFLSINLSFHYLIITHLHTES